MFTPGILSPQAGYEVIEEGDSSVPQFTLSSDKAVTGERRDRSRSNSDVGKYGSFPKSTRNKKNGSGDASMVNPWHLLKQRDSSSDDAISKESVWRVRQGWSPSSRYDGSYNTDDKDAILQSCFYCRAVIKITHTFHV
jgi:hypothetical protein